MSGLPADPLHQVQVRAGLLGGAAIQLAKVVDLGSQAPRGVLHFRGAPDWGMGAANATPHKSNPCATGRRMGSRSSAGVENMPRSCAGHHGVCSGKAGRAILWDLPNGSETGHPEVQTEQVSW